MRAEAPHMSMSARIAVILLCTACISLPASRARADELALGGQVLFGTEGHVEPSNNANATDPIPFVVVDAHIKHFEVSGELVPLPAIPIADSTSGIHSIKLNYFDGTVRYWTGGRQQWCVGLGQTLWNQQTEYLSMPVQYDASRGAGTRYEIGNAIPVFSRDALETIVGVSPTIHARLSYTFGSPGFAAPPVSEVESQVDVKLALLQPAGRWRFEYGVRYMNMTARFDDRSFADANHVAGAFVAALYAFSGSR